MSEDIRQAMLDYWKEHSKEGSVQEMMLDTSAEELTKEELPEILSYLPDFKGKTVIELGAGIGRFTSELAKKAEKVIAVDFLEDFLEKNKKTNQHWGNIEFVVADVTQMDRPEVSVDLIFSNWLLMYLEDTEVQNLFEKFLTWLRPGGHLFIRESCMHQSGDKKRGHNPTIYREPEIYEAMYSSVFTTSQVNRTFGFSLVLSKSVHTYIKRKNNNNQIVWLLQKAMKNSNPIFKLKSHRDFINQQHQLTKKILLREKIIGRCFDNLGELEAVQFAGKLKLQPGQRVLNIGGGLGGSAFFMAKNFGVKVKVVDLSSNKIKVGLDRAQEVGISPDDICFEVADVTMREFASESFDLVFSPNFIFKIADKLALFRKINKLLRPGGGILITDYCCPANEKAEEFKDYLPDKGFSFLSSHNYKKVLKDAGFAEVQFEDKTDQFSDVIKRKLKQSNAMKHDLTQDFECDEVSSLVEDWKQIQNHVKFGSLLWGLFSAKKPAINKELCYLGLK